MKTYDEILTRMKTAFFEECGKNVDNAGDIDARFQAVASELFSLSCYNEFLLKQAFAQTASGEYLEKHAQMRDMTRHSATRATGELTFSISYAAETEITVPRGTICSSTEHPYIQYSTTQDGAIAPGETAVTVPAEALECGVQYNCLAGTVTRIVNPPTGIEYVTNKKAFTGGNNVEGDELLRRRIMDSFKISKGMSREYIEALIMKLDFVRDCRVYDTRGGRVLVRVRTADNTISREQSEQVKDKMLINTLMDEAIAVYASQPEKFSLNIDVTGAKATAQEISSVVQLICESLRIDQDLDLDLLEYRLADYGYCKVSSPTQLSKLVVCPEGKHLILEKCEVFVDV